MAFHFRRRIRSVTIEDGTGLTRCTELSPTARNIMPVEVWRKHVREEVVLCLCGPISEWLYSSTSDPTAWAADMRMARRWLQELGVDGIPPAFVATTRRLLMGRWSAVRGVAARLIENGSMNGGDVTALCREVWRRV